ncbi:signal transduction histidine kinase [Tamaricihabitans halophyticus]|uniref:Signal transduction histidine kinase n=1 Tax=Tamaricihabitans halophyticus TaxID=1262583 RepID=A0A4R2QS95_9PSEU|nr:sensor histidine kinase [Tamaricihabitans halophyticus]TCP49921.1 signal transduction histidine kinase [Tamaricihabitans halophyticus]
MSVEQEEGQEYWWGTILLPYPLLAISTVFAVLQRDIAVPVPAMLTLALAAAGWLILFDTNRRWRERGIGQTLYYTGLIGLLAGLVALAPWYGIFGFIGYTHAYEYLRNQWRYLGSTVTSMIMAVSYLGGLSRIGGGDWWQWGLVALVSTILSGACFSIMDMTDRRNREQHRTLAELHEANQRLEAALTENAGLHAKLIAQARTAGVLDERQRMAHEIHDTLAQGLAGIVTQLQAAEQAHDEPRTAHRHTSNAMNLARESLVEARRTVRAMGPEPLAESRLPDAIGDVVRRWAEVNHIDATLSTTGDPRPMHADVEVTLLRTAQEALANVAKHANANRVGLTLSYLTDRVLLDVRDDGVGFDPDAKRANDSLYGGFGLIGMRKRVRRLAGQLDIEAEPGGGTAISASVPAIPVGGGQ